MPVIFELYPNIPSSEIIIWKHKNNNNMYSMGIIILYATNKCS